ncbi:MAG: leucyl aminopeptidase [Bryobacterales bacterium]|nr:leucyl aminopeptidase [Bryobacterales bacterium]
MECKLVYAPLEQVEADAVAVVLFEDGEGIPAAKAWLDELKSSGEFTGKPGEMTVLHLPQGLKAKRLVVVGGGKKDKFDAAALRKTVGALVRALKQKGVKRLAFMLGGGSAEAAVEGAVEGAILGNYEPDMNKPSTDAKPLEAFDVVAAAKTPQLEPALRRGVILAEAQNFTRDLGNEPANRMTPLALASKAREMAAAYGLDIEVLERDRMRQLGMGSLLGVAQGSDEPPVFIVLRYQPAGGAKSKDHLALIGKGVTFDSGGISIKPADGMEKMKYDMCGAAAVLGAMRAIAQLKPSVTVTGFVPSVENMLSGRAQRPGDIVKSLSGKTIEVLNTDAEGRLILNDAITYAKQLGCTHLVDAATLTGAIVVALGSVNTGVFTNNDALLGRVMAAAKDEGEKMWHMPLDEDYKDLLKSAFADLANIGGRWGGAISAAWFLKEFAEDTPWVHLDIAGTAWLDDAKPFLAKGPTGVCVRTFAKLAQSWQ